VSRLNPEAKPWLTNFFSIAEKVYTVDLVAEEFSILAPKNEKAIEASAQPKPAKKPARTRK
jgi:hypothetical protein